jgi:nucleoid-associated protein YgaU
VQADDTLWGIAKKVYGKGSLWRTIYDANRDKIKDPDRPTAGAVLTVPPKPKD